MKKKLFKYKRNRILFELTIILLLSVIFIIKENSMPLIRTNSFWDKYIEYIFTKSSNDSTLYNISISYIAAYIFYLIQIYLPSVSEHTHGNILLKQNIEKYINYIKILILSINELLEYNKNQLNIRNQINEIYIIEKSKKMIFKFTYLRSYEKIKTQIIKFNNDIFTNPALNYLDKNVSELLCSLPITELFTLSDNIYQQKNHLINTKIIDNEAIKKMNSIIDELQKRYGFHFETYSITDDLRQQEQYVSQSIYMAQYTENELEIKVKLHDKMFSTK